MTKVRFQPYVAVTKNEWDDYTIPDRVSSWYITDAMEEIYWNENEDQVDPHTEVPGICMLITTGKKDIQVSIPWTDLVLALRDVLKEANIGAELHFGSGSDS